MSANEILDIIGTLNSEQQEAFYTNLRASGAFTEEEIRHIQEQAFYRKLFTNQLFYNEVMNTMCAKVYQELMV